MVQEGARALRQAGAGYTPPSARYRPSLRAHGPDFDHHRSRRLRRPRHERPAPSGAQYNRRVTARRAEETGGSAPCDPTCIIRRARARGNHHSPTWSIFAHPGGQKMNCNPGSQGLVAGPFPDQTRRLTRRSAGRGALVRAGATDARAPELESKRSSLSSSFTCQQLT